MLNTIINNIPILAGACDFFDSPSANTAFTKIIGLSKLFVRILQIVVPILLVVLGSIDLGKAVLAPKESEMEKAWKPFLKRIVAAVIVFLIPLLVGVVLNLVNGKEWKECRNAAKEKGHWSNLLNNNPLDIK